MNPFTKLPAPRDGETITVIIPNPRNDTNQVFIFHRDGDGYIRRHSYIEPSRFHAPTGNKP